MSIATEPVRYMDALNAGIADAMEADERVVLIGIDVGAGGGIFTVTKGLHERFGDDRVIDTPISEMGFVGAAVGAAMTGPAADRRDHVHGLHRRLPGPDPQPGGEAAVHDLRRAPVPDRLPHPDRRRPQRRRPALAEPRDDARAHPGPAGRDARHRDRRARPARRGRRGPEPGRVRREPPPLRHEGRGRRGPAADRQGARGARRRRRDRRHLGPDAARVPEGGRGVLGLDRGHRPALARPARHGDGPRARPSAPAGCSSSTRRSRTSAPGRRSPPARARSSTTSCACPVQPHRRADRPHAVQPGARALASCPPPPPSWPPRRPWSAKADPAARDVRRREIRRHAAMGSADATDRPDAAVGR